MIQKNNCLSNQELDQFTALVKKSSKHRPAVELMNYKPIEYKQYLRNIRTSAGERIKITNTQTCKSRLSARRMVGGSPAIRSIEREGLPRSKSYYYTNKCQLLSLKEFNILVERAQQKMRRKRKQEERVDRKILIAQVQNSVQLTNKVRLRLTSAVALKLKNYME